MFAIIFTTILLIDVFSSENLITTFVGAAVTYGLTHWIKSKTGLQGVGALIVAIAGSFLMAAVAFLISTVLNGTPLSWDLLPVAATQIFALATIAYKAIMADSSQSV